MKPYIDDSSDDESEIGEYDLVQSFVDYCLERNIINPDPKLSLSFAVHALGVATLNNKNSRDIYRDVAGNVVGIDNIVEKREAFEAYIRLSISELIRDLVEEVQSSASLDGRGVDDAIYGAHGRILTYLNDMASSSDGNQVIEEVVQSCLDYNNFYRELSNNSYEGILENFSKLTYCLTSLSDTLRNNAVDMGEDKEVKFFDEWGSVVKESLTNDKLSKILQKLRPARDVLDTNVKLENPDSKAFIKNILLSNRSDKRRLKNLADFDLYQTGEEEVYRSWAFKPVTQDALEKAKITRNTQNRQSWISNVGSYDEIAKILNGFKKNIQEKYGMSMPDKYLATAIRNNINGEEISHYYYQDLLKGDQKQFDQLIASTSQLLFGVEVIRNPASIIMNQMMLDLIIDHEYSFQQMLTRDKSLTVEAFLRSNYNIADNFESGVIESHIFSNDDLKDYRSGGMMPMSHSGVMSIARKLEKEYQVRAAKYMPKPYEYKGSLTVDSNDKSIKDTKQLIMLEGIIVDEWFNKEVLPTLEDEIDDLEDLSIQDKLTYLKEAVKKSVKFKWYKGVYIDDIKKFGVRAAEI